MTKEAVDRHLYLLRALAGQRYGRTLEDLHRELHEDLGVGVSMRTLRRDIDALSVQFPIIDEERDNNRYYKIMDHFKLEPIQCSFEELMALVFMNRIMDSLGSDPIVTSGRKLTRRLVAGLPDLQQRYLEGIYRHFYVELPSKETQGGQIQIFADAVRRHKEVRIRYHAFNSDEVSQRVIHPYAIYFRQQYYIVAWCTTRQAFREFRLDRVLGVEPLESSFQPRDFNYDEYCRHSWDALRGAGKYEVVLKFTPASQRFIQEYDGHKADSLRMLEDGSLEFKKTVNVLDEIIPWILSHGSEVEVLAPQQLKDIITETITLQAKKMGIV